MNQDRTKRKLTAILSADVVGYSRLMEEDEDWTIKTLEENKRMISEFIDEYKGRVVDAPGDNILAEFSSVTNAVECAVKIQQELKYKNANLVEDRRMEFRIGINQGEVVEEDGRIYGSGVNIAARLEGLTEAGGICISRRAYDHVKTQLDLSYEYMGEQCVKNISEPIRVYRVLMDSKTGGKVIGEKRFLGRMSRRMALASIIILIIIAAGSICWNIYSHRLKKEETPNTIAVLPFEDDSPGKDQEYFADGIAEELLNSFTRISELEVRGRTSSFYFKDKNEDLSTISKMLNVKYILEGSVRKAGNQVRITVQLINAREDKHIWSQPYDFTMDDIFAIQDNIAKSVADTLQITLGVGELGRAPGMTSNIAAYDAFLTGNSLLSKVGRENISQAIEYLEQAVALDPDFAIGWNALAAAYNRAVTFIPERGEEFSEKRKTALSRVVELIPKTDLALTIAASQSGDWVEVERYYKKAFTLAPAAYGANFGYGFFLNRTGRVTEAIDYIQRAALMEPLSANVQNVLGFTYEFNGNIDAAIMTMNKARDLSDQPAILNASLLVLALEEDNRALIDEYMALVHNTLLLGINKRSNTRDINQVMYALLDTPEKAGAELRLFLTDPAYKNPMSRYLIAIWASYFEEHELALQLWKESFGLNPDLFWQVWRPIHKGMRKLPGFKDQVREMGLVDYWRKTGNWGDFCHSVGDDDFECE